MKKIEAIIRKTKFEEVKEALLEADIEWFTYMEARGVGKARQSRIYRGVMYGTDIIERLRLTIIVRDQNVDKTVVAIMNAARTGEVGDGRIFVIDVLDSYSIRTGENGDHTLYIAPNGVKTAKTAK
ncbi:MAG: P-II family nitrogen regulator [Rikenellaceae bacterium]|nr:P-II family nitrogen regulator [Rikenellaceae bacterium]